MAEADALAAFFYGKNQANEFVNKTLEQMFPACLNDFNFSLLSDDEKQEIEAVCEKWKDEPTQVIVNFTHHQKPWKLCRANEVIPYELILQEEPENVY